MTTPNPEPLNPVDTAALDALVEAGFDPTAIPAELAEGAGRVLRLLGTLEHLADEPAPPDLAAQTLRRIQAASPEPSTVELATLGEADAAAVDALVEAEFDLDRVPAELRERAKRAALLLGLLDHLPEHRTGDLLLPRTLQHIERERQALRFDRQIATLTSGEVPRGGLRLSELGAVAAMLLLGISVLWPMLSKARSDARQIVCSANLESAGKALAGYASDFGGAMPAVAARLGDPWSLTNRFNDDGTALSNSAHLFNLVKTGYASMADLACPTNLNAALAADADTRDWPTTASVSYSYQNQYTTDRPKLNGGPVIAVLADKNPLFATGQFRMEVCLKKRDANSANHGSGTGQNVLLTDGRVGWLTTPRVQHDNIFHAGEDGFDYYTGLEAPADESDSFLVP